MGKRGANGKASLFAYSEVISHTKNIYHAMIVSIDRPIIYLCVVFSVFFKCKISLVRGEWVHGVGITLLKIICHSQKRHLWSCDDSLRQNEKTLHR